MDQYGVFGHFLTQKELKVKTLRHFLGPVGRPQGTFNHSMDWQDAQMVYLDFDPVLDPKIWIINGVFGHFFTQKELKVKTLRNFWGPVGRP